MTLSSFESVILYSIEKGDNFLMECLPWYAFLCILKQIKFPSYKSEKT